MCQALGLEEDHSTAERKWKELLVQEWLYQTYGAEGDSVKKEQFQSQHAHQEEERQILHYGVTNIIILCTDCICRTGKEVIKWSEMKSNFTKI